MDKYYYFPILKTRPSEVTAYEFLDESIKNEVLPIIEMTGALGYTYPKNYKIESLRNRTRPGDINTKIKKILGLVGNRKFILDITDDISLKYYGLGDSNGGLLDNSDGYNAWLTFLKQDQNFQRQVIPTIQFNTDYRSDVEKQIVSLNNTFDYIALKLPIFSSATQGVNSIIFNDSIQRIIDWAVQYITGNKLILILDFGYITDFEKYRTFVETGLSSITNISRLKALIPVSSSFPNFVVNAPKPITITENDISDCVKNKLGTNNIYHGDYSGIHPVKYEMGGGGWIPRIDYVIRDSITKRPKEYDYVRGSTRNTSSEYPILAKKVINSGNYLEMNELSVKGDMCIAAKANKSQEGKAPSYWIGVRSNLYMTMQYIYLKKQKSFLAL